MVNKQKVETKIALIGCGPACAAAAIQLIRSGFEPLIICKSNQTTLRNANLIENLIGFPNGISGENLNKLIKQHLENNSARMIQDKVISVKRKESKFVIETNRNYIEAQFVVIGSGTIPKILNVEGEEESYKNKLLFYEIYNAKNHAEDKSISIVGSGDAAYDYALSLSEIAKEITIIQRTNKKSKSLALLQKRAAKNKKITVFSGRAIKKIFSEEKTEIKQLEISFNDTFETVKTNLILVAIGRKANIEFLSPELLKEFNSLANTVNTNINDSKIYFIGDIKNGLYRQIAIATGEGIRTAMEIVNRIKSES